eukprot:14247310-Alexandrium_andersonii.AAC.1
MTEAPIRGPGRGSRPSEQRRGPGNDSPPGKRTKLLEAPLPIRCYPSLPMQRLLKSEQASATSHKE